MFLLTLLPSFLYMRCHTESGRERERERRGEGVGGALSVKFIRHYNVEHVVMIIMLKMELH